MEDHGYCHSHRRDVVPFRGLMLCLSVVLMVLWRGEAIRLRRG
jgi:hypothetical protein